MEIVIAVSTISLLGLIFGIGLAFASRIFFVKTDPRVDEILAALPGANCGVCGFAGCQGLAEALAKGRAAPEGCFPGGYDVHEKVAKILGVEAKVKAKVIATLICNGGRRAPDKCDYRGPKDCAAASMLMGGQKACWFGCLEFGDCASACPFGAIRMDENGLPAINERLCTGCGKCVEACPKKVLVLRPAEARAWVVCNSTDKGAVVTKVCGYGCIGCRVCEKLSGGVFEVKDNLARVYYDKAKPETDWNKTAEKCPTKVIIRRRHEQVCDGDNGCAV